MVRTASTMLPLGTVAPDFQLPAVNGGDLVSLATFAEKKALLLVFLCRHCPFVIHIQEELARIGQDFVPQGLGMVAISANNAAQYSEDRPEKLAEMAQSLGFNFPLCYDETQAVAKAYTAACTPDFFLFDGDRRLVYRGQLDDSRPGNDRPVTGADLRGAIASALAGQPISPDQKPSIGCNIKWKPGNEPDYFG